VRRRSVRANTPNRQRYYGGEHGEAVDPLTTFNIAISVVLLSVASVMEIDRP
jgi:hypothetical protein